MSGDLQKVLIFKGNWQKFNLRIRKPKPIGEEKEIKQDEEKLIPKKDIDSRVNKTTYVDQSIGSIKEYAKILKVIEMQI
jgi:hypothetical protein